MTEIQTEVQGCVNRDPRSCLTDLSSVHLMHVHAAARCDSVEPRRGLCRRFSLFGRPRILPTSSDFLFFFFIPFCQPVLFNLLGNFIFPLRVRDLSGQLFPSLYTLLHGRCWASRAKSSCLQETPHRNALLVSASLLRVELS